MIAGATELTNGGAFFTGDVRLAVGNILSGRRERIAVDGRVNENEVTYCGAMDQLSFASSVEG